MSRVLGTVVEADGVSPAIISYENGRITAFNRLDPAIADDILHMHGDATLYDFKRFLIFPGFVDIHTHCREDVSGNDTHKEDYTTVGLAALSGGVVCVADMPNNPVVPNTKERYEAKAAIAKAKCSIDVLLYAGVGADSKPFDDLPYKVFVGPSTNHCDDLNFANYGRLSTTLKNYRGHSVSFHCEDPALLSVLTKEPTHETRRPAIAEWTCIDVICDMIAHHGLAGKICHVSTKAGLETIVSHKAQGTTVTCEVTPHHLYFDTTMITPENRRFLQMNPPIRNPEDRQALLEGVRQGHFDFLATDHAPHTTAEKLKGTSGVPQLDTYGPFVAWLIKEQNVDPVTIFKMACKNPGEWVHRFWSDRLLGRIAVGYEANFTVLDMTKSAVEGRPLYTKCGWSPFDLRLLPGVVKSVYHQGVKVVDDLYMAPVKTSLVV